MLKKIKRTFMRSNLAKENISAVHDDDLLTFLESIGLLHSVRAGKEKCKFCRETIDISSIQTIFPDSGSIKIACNREECIQQFLEYTGDSQ